MSSTSRVLIGFRAADAFVCCLIEGGLISFVGFFLWGLGYVCCLLDLELMSSMECWYMHVFCVQQFLFLLCWSDSGRLMLFRISEVFERMGEVLWFLGCEVWFFLWKLNVELVSSTREQEWPRIICVLCLKIYMRIDQIDSGRPVIRSSRGLWLEGWVFIFCAFCGF
jgi:hypothetical protein